MSFKAIHIPYIVWKVIITVNASSESHRAQICKFLTLFQNAVVIRDYQVIGLSVRHHFVGQNSSLEVVAAAEPALDSRVVEKPFSLPYTFQKRSDLLPHQDFGSLLLIVLAHIILVQKLNNFEVFDGLKITNYDVEVHHTEAFMVFVIALVNVFKFELLCLKVQFLFWLQMSLLLLFGAPANAWWLWQHFKNMMIKKACVGFLAIFMLLWLWSCRCHNGAGLFRTLSRLKRARAWFVWR